jgi:hypothetical protein
VGNKIEHWLVVLFVITAAAAFDDIAYVLLPPSDFFSRAETDVTTTIVPVRFYL